MAKTALEVLADNLNRLREVEGNPRTQAEIGSKAGVDQKTVGRTLAASNATSVDKLDGFAKAFKVKPWHLLVPGLDPAALPGERPPPPSFSSKALEVAGLYDQIEPGQRHIIEAMAHALQRPVVTQSAEPQWSEPTRAPAVDRRKPAESTPARSSERRGP